jgi:hypothetical protein
MESQKKKPVMMN